MRYRLPRYRALIGLSVLASVAAATSAGTVSATTTACDAVTQQTKAPARAVEPDAPALPSFHGGAVRWFTDGPQRAPLNLRLQGGEDCTSAVDLPDPPVTVTGTTLGYGDDYDVACPYDGSDAPDVVYAYTPATDMMVDITLCDGPTDYDSKIYIYDACPPTPDDLVACNDDACVSWSGQRYVSALTAVELTAGTTYYIVIDGYGGAAGAYTMDVAERGAPPTCPPDSLLGYPPLANYVAAEPVDTTLPFDPNDAFAGLTDAATGVRFWGLTLMYDSDSGAWSPCQEQPLDVLVEFVSVEYPYNEVICSYALTATGTPVGVVGPDDYVVYEYEVMFPEPCHMPVGRLSIRGADGDDCYLLWAVGETRRVPGVDSARFAWCLLGDGTPITGACCDDLTGTCVDDVAAVDCAGYLAPRMTCADLAPTCAAGLGACCAADVGCTVTSALDCADEEICAGDMNCDGVVSPADIDPFVIALTAGQAAYEAQFPDCRYANADCQHDGTVSVADIDLFVQQLVASSRCPTGVWHGRGTDCGDCPGVVPPTLSLPADLPFVWSSRLCGLGNDFEGDCLSPADGGEDMEIELVVTEPATTIQIALVRRSDYALFGAAVLDGPVGAGVCLATKITQTDDLELDPIVLGPGTYTLVIDQEARTWNECLEFDLRIRAVTPVGRCCLPSDALPQPCYVTAEDECLDLGGMWHVGEDCSTLCQPGPFAADGQDCASAIAIGALPFVMDIDTAAYGADGPHSDCDPWQTDAAMPSDAWFVWTASSDALVCARATDDLGAGIVAVRDACDGAEIICAHAGAPACWPAFAGETYYIQVGTAGRWPVATQRTFTLAVESEGACCFDAGGCEALSPSACQSAGGVFLGFGSICGEFPCPQDPGATCDDPILIDLDFADPELYFVDLAGSTRNRGDDHHETCLEGFDEGADVFYRFELAEVASLQFEVVATYSGLLIADGCPPTMWFTRADEH
jgi:hypothetical protein